MNKKTTLFLLVIVFLMPVKSHGMLTVECADINYVVQNADVIIKGDVIKVEAREGENGMIFTYVDIRVAKYIKGKGERVLQIKIPGGCVGDSCLGVEDTPTFLEGERGYLCLTQDYQPICGKGILGRLPAGY